MSMNESIITTKYRIKGKVSEVTEYRGKIFLNANLVHLGNAVFHDCVFMDAKIRVCGIHKNKKPSVVLGEATSSKFFGCSFIGRCEMNGPELMLVGCNFDEVVTGGNKVRVYFSDGNYLKILPRHQLRRECELWDAAIRSLHIRDSKLTPSAGSNVGVVDTNSHVSNRYSNSYIHRLIDRNPEWDSYNSRQPGNIGEIIKG